MAPSCRSTSLCQLWLSDHVFPPYTSPSSHRSDQLTTEALSYDVLAHDPAFHPFRPWKGTVPPDHAIDWTGIFTHKDFAGWQSYPEEWYAEPMLPRRDDE